MPRNSSVDERIVEMRIDNKNFESGAKKTISTLEKLDKALKIKSDSKAIDDLERSVNKFDTSNMTKGLEKVQMSFSALEIAGMRVISNLTDSIMGFATKTAKALTIDQVTAGFSKYESMLESTQTIMAATADQIGEGLNAEGLPYRWATQEEQMADIQKYLDGLLWYTDETSYSFTDMTNNLGKFLSAGVDLEDAYKSMMGIASWGATAGAKPGEVARAMYNISQAMGTGAMKAIDWRSIENANMATLDFKRNAIMVANELHKLDHVVSEVAKDGQGNDGFMLAGAKDMYNTAGYIQNMTDEEVEKIIITAENFRDGLQQNWFDKDVMTAVFERYGRFAEQLRQETEATGLEATDLLQLLDKYRMIGRDNTSSWQKYADDLGMDVNELLDSIQRLDDIGLVYSETGFRMGQEAKTFTDALEATKDAVSSQWMKTFQYIFGDYLQAKEFWTEVTGTLWDIFAAGGKRRNEILKSWSQTADEVGKTGRDYLLGIEYDDEGEVKFQGALWNVLSAIQSVTNPIKEALAEVFGLDEAENTGIMLRELTRRFQEFTSQLGFSAEAGEGVKSVFKGIFSVLKTGLKVVGTGVSVISRIGMVIGNIADGLIAFTTGQISLSELFDRIGNSITSILPTEEKLLALWDRMKTKYTELTTAFQNGTFWETVKSYLPSWQNFKDLISTIGDKLAEKYPQIFEMFNRWKDQHTVFGNIIDLFKGGFASIDGFLKSINIDSTKISQAFKDLGETFSKILDFVFGDTSEVSKNVQNFFSAVFQGMNNSIKEWKPGDIFNAIKTAGFAVLLAHIGNLMIGFKKMTAEFTSIGGAVRGVLGDTGMLLNDIGKSFRANAFIKMAAAFAILAASLVALTFVDADKLTHVIVTMSLMVGVIGLFMKSIGGFSSLFGDKFSNNATMSGNRITLFNNFASILMGFAALLGTIAVVITIARKTNPTTLISVIIGVIALMAGMALLTREMGKIQFEDSRGVIGAILSLSLALNMMIPVLITMAVMPFNRYLQALFGVAALLASLGGVLTLMNHWKVDGANMLKVAGSIGILALALNALIPIIGVLGVMPGAGFGKAFAGLLGLLAVLVGVTAALNALKIDGKNMLAIAGAMAIVALAINLLMPALGMLGAGITAFIAMVPWNKLAKNMGGFVVAFAKILALSFVITTFGVAIMFVGAGILALGAGLIFAAVGAMGLAVAMGPLAISLTGFVKAINEIEAVDVGKILALAIAFAAIGGAVVAIIAIINKLVNGKGPGSKLGSFLTGLSAKFGEVGPKVSQKIQEAFPKILEMLGGLLIMAGLYFMGIVPDLTKILVDTIVTLLDSLANEVASNSGQIAHSIARIIKEIVGIGATVLSELFTGDDSTRLSWAETSLLSIAGILGIIKMRADTTDVSKPFKGLSSIFGKGGGLAGAAANGGWLSGLSKYFTAAGAGLGEFGGAATLATAGFGGLLAALGLVPTIMADNKMSADYTAQAFDGMGNSVTELAAKANELAAIQREGEAALYDYTGTSTVSYQESRYAAEAYKTVVEDLATQLGLSTSEIYSQIAAADGDVTKIAALTQSTKELSGAEQQRADQQAASRGQIDQTASSVDNTISSVEDLKASLAGLDPTAALEKFSTLKIDSSVLGDLGLSDWLSQNQGTFTGIGSDIIAGISSGMNTDGAILTSDMTAIADMLPPAFKSVLGIASPSTVMAEAASWIPASIEQGITANSGVATGAMTSLASGLLSAVTTVFQTDGPAAGSNGVIGIANGVYENLQLAYDAGAAAGGAFMQGYDNATDTHSPSREMMKRGIYAIQGLVNGLRENQGDVYSEASGLGYGMIQTLQNAMSQVAMLAMNEFDFNPVITPVVDLTNINAATGSINGALSGAHVGISGEIIGSVARRLDQAERVASNMEARSQTINNTGDSFTFNIYASEGMDENAIADAVMNRMQTRMVRRGAAFG